MDNFDYPIPYIFRLGDNNKNLFYFGAKHSNDSDDPQFIKLENFWHDFLTVISGERVVLIESFPLPDFTLDKYSAAKKFGERGFIISLAMESGVPFFWPESDCIAQEINELKQIFPEELIIYFYTIRTAVSLSKRKGLEDFRSILTRSLESSKNRFNWQNTFYSINDLEVAHLKIFGKSINSSQLVTLERSVAPIYDDSVINKIAKISSNIRNRIIVSSAEKYLNEGKNVFMLFGAHHAFLQKDYFLRFFE